MDMRSSWKYSEKTISKYRNKKIDYDGYTFDSLKECRRYKELKILERTGIITDLKVHYSYTLIEKSKHGREIKYIADFVYVNGTETIVEDVKSPVSKTPVYRLKKRLLAERYGLEIKEV